MLHEEMTLQFQSKTELFINLALQVKLAICAIRPVVLMCRGNNSAVWWGTVVSTLSMPILPQSKYTTYCMLLRGWGLGKTIPFTAFCLEGGGCTLHSGGWGPGKTVPFTACCLEGWGWARLLPFTARNLIDRITISYLESHSVTSSH